MTQRGTIMQQRAQEAHRLQQGLNALRDDAQYFMQPSMKGLHDAAAAELNDGHLLLDALPPSITHENAEDAAEALVGGELAELGSFADSMRQLFNTMTAPTTDGKPLDANQARGRIKQAATKLYDMTRRDAVLEGRPALAAMLPDYPDIAKALEGIENAGEEAADLLESSAIARQLLQQAHDSTPNR